MSKTIYPRFFIRLRGILARAPRVRGALIKFAERLFNAGPDAPFVAARRRYERRIEGGATPTPPTLLRLAAYRRRIPDSIETFQILGLPKFRLTTSYDSLAVQQVFWVGPRWAMRLGAGLDLWRQLCGRSANVVEIGANVGLYAIAGASSADVRYTAFEPHPRSCAALHANLELNGLTSVHVMEAATVPDRGTEAVELICPTGTDRATPSGAMVKGSSFDDHDTVRQHESILVKAVPIEEAIAGCDLVKIDVEGLEAKLLDGAWEQLAASKPAIMIEVHDFNVDLRRLLPGLLDALGANMYAMCYDHLVPVARGAVAEGPLAAKYASYDFLIVPERRAAMATGLVGSAAALDN